MITLVLTYFLVTYLLIPAGFFRWWVSHFVPLKNFQRTKTQEITFAVGSSVIPFLVAFSLLWFGLIQRPRIVTGGFAERRADYKQFYEFISRDDALNDQSRATFWQTAT